MKQHSQFYVRSVGWILLLTAAAKLYSTTGTAKVLDIPEALLPMSIRQALWLIGLIEAAIAAMEDGYRRHAAGRMPTPGHDHFAYSVESS